MSQMPGESNTRTSELALHVPLLYAFKVLPLTPLAQKLRPTRLTVNVFYAALFLSRKNLVALGDSHYRLIFLFGLSLVLYFSPYCYSIYFLGLAKSFLSLVDLTILSPFQSSLTIIPFGFLSSYSLLLLLFLSVVEVDSVVPAQWLFLFTTGKVSTDWQFTSPKCLFLRRKANYKFWK